MHEPLKYPTNDFDRSSVLLSTLGNFWNSIFEARDELGSYVTATAFTAAESQRQLLEVFAGLSHQTIPAFHRKQMTMLVLEKSAMNAGSLGSAEFNNNDNTFDDGQLRFNKKVDNAGYRFPTPTNLIAVNQIVDSPTNPKVVLMRNRDFTIDARGFVTFVKNPFVNGFASYRKNNTDCIYAWGLAADYDYSYIYNQFAYALNLRLKSSEGYKELTSALIGSLANGGASAQAVNVALSAICDTPLTIEKEERVEKIFEDAHGKCVVTDKHVYRFSTKARTLVSLGQKLYAGQPLVDTLVITDTVAPNRFLNLADNQPLYESNSAVFLITQDFEFVETQSDEQIILRAAGKQCPEPLEDLRAVALGRNMLAPCFHGDLLFENKEVDVVVNENHRSGRTYVSFELNGHPADVKRFFDETHDRAINAPVKNCADDIEEQPKTLARCLARWHISDEPTADDIPAKINPLQFLISNVLRNNVFIVRIKIAGLGQNHLDLYNISHVRQLLPPQTVMLAVLTYEADSDEVNTSAMAETYEFFKGLEQVNDSISTANVLDNGARLHIVSGNCQ